MGAVLGIAILLFGGGFFARGVAQARQGAWAGPRTSGMRQRASKGGEQRPVRHELKLLREKAHLDNWVKQQDHDRKNGGQSQGGTPAARAPNPLQRAYANVRARSHGNTASGNGTPGTIIPPAAQTRPAPAPQAPPQAPPQHVNTQASNGRTATVASNGSGHAAEKLIEGINQIHAEAAAGGIHAKQAALKACHEACVRFASMASMLSRQMSEPGQNYGPEVTEPVGKSATQLQASAMTFSEADANLSTLINMTVGDLANSARQAPHHQELSENGSH